jgi:uncharacterized membrane protein YpjA
MERLLRWTLDSILRQPLLFWTCVIANLLGAVSGGVWWYGPMLWESPLWALPFIPDCPLAALVGSIALLGLRAGKRWPFFYALVAFACMKYGAWTISFWLRHWSLAGQAFPIEILLVVTHIGLFIEGLLFVPHIGPLSLPKRLAVIGWFVLSIFVDYGLGYHPPLASYVTPTFVFWLATMLTVVLGAGLLLLPRRAPHAVVRPATA